MSGFGRDQGFAQINDFTNVKAVRVKLG